MASGNGFLDRRIALFEPNPDFTTNPSLVCLVEALRKAGARVDVMMPEVGDYLPADVLVTPYPFPQRLKLWRGNVKKTMMGLRAFVRRKKTFDRWFSKGQYDLIIGVDSLGVIEGYRYAGRFGVPLVYLNFEIFFRDELSVDWEIREKEQEYPASRFADMVVIQDPVRARLLAQENGLRRDRFVYLPVSPGGKRSVEKSNALRSRFGLSEKQYVVLQSGSFAQWTYADELLESVSEWPREFMLVIHTHYKKQETDRFFRTIRKRRLSNVLVTTDPLPTEEYEKLVASADIGLVLYKPTAPDRYLQKNIAHIGLASGKFSFYMKHGVPVVSIAQNCYEDLLADYRFGENLSSFDELPAALRRIRGNSRRYSDEAQRLYRERLDFDIHWPNLSAKLMELMQ